MVLYVVPHKSTYIELESIIVESSQSGPLSFDGKKARAMLFDSYRRKKDGFFV